MKAIHFEPEMEQIKQEIWKIYLAISNTKGVNKKMVKLFYQFLIHRQLTQKQLRTLTGLSLGYISETLNYYLSFNIIDRAVIEGTNKYIYTLKSSFLGLSKIMFKEVVQEIHRLQSYYYLLLSQELNPDSLQYKSNQPVVKAIRRILEFLETFEHISVQVSHMFDDSIETELTTPNDGSELSKSQNFQKINEMVDYFAESKVLPYNQNARKKMFAAMIVQNEFTKKELRNLVDVSYKTFNEHFTFFKDTRDILDVIDLDKAPIKYRIKPLDQVLTRNVTATSDETLSKVHRLVEIKTYLEENRKKLEPKAGYHELLQFIQDYFDITTKMKAYRAKNIP